jgi:hypothetical protein
MTATIQVFTYKDGLLARLAHDLRLTLRRFEIQRDGAAITARFWPGSLHVDGAIDRHGQLDVNTLSDNDRRKIGENIADDVLHLDRFPEASFRGQIVGDAVEGELSMAGRSASVRVPVQAAGGRLRGEVILVPSRWGITPYKALAGAIKLQDRVRVVVDLPADPAGSAETPETCTWRAG